jgi:HD superfamily phosphohydrolase YqeK
LTYEVGEQFDVKDVQDALSAVGIHESQIAKAGSEETQLQVRVADLGENADDMRKAFEEELEKKYVNLTYVNLQTVGAVAGRDLLQNALKACLIVFVCLLIYIGIRFDLKSGLAALVALLHDVARSEPGHARLGAAWLRELGYDKAAGLVEQHHDLQSEELNEAAILYIADKCVQGERRVSVQERFAESERKCLTAEAKASHAARLARALRIREEIHRLCGRTVLE